MLPPEIIREIIYQAPFEVFCAFAKTSKDNLAYCKKILPIRAKEWLITRNNTDDQSSMLPNRVLHDYYYNCSYYMPTIHAFYHYGKLMIKIDRSRGMFDVYVRLFSNGNEIAGYNYIRTGGMYKLSSFKLTNVGSFVVDFESGIGFIPEISTRETILNVYERLSKENIYDKILERIDKMDYFQYDTNGFSIDVKIKDKKLLIARPQQRPITHEIYHVRPEIVTIIKSLVLPEIFNIIKHWLCPEFEPPEIGPN